jgi:ABC-type Fe3+-siderophore transport system permease subunit
MSRAPRGAVAILLGVAVLASGCLYQGLHRVAFRNPSLAEADVSEHQSTQAFTLFGLVDTSGSVHTQAIDVSEVCPGRFAEIVHHQTAPQASWIPLVPLLIAPFVSQSTIEYRCVEE